MFDEPAENEPQEPDPEADLPDPERDLVSIPEVPTPGDPSNAPTELAVAFWAAVLVVNAALLATSLGVLFVVVLQRWALGGVLTAVGVGLFLDAYRRYRQVTRTDGDE